MALLSMMQSYGSTSSTSTSSFPFEKEEGTASSSVGLVEEEKALSKPAVSPDSEDIDMQKKQMHNQSYYDKRHYIQQSGKTGKTRFSVIPTAYSFLLVSVVMAIALSAVTQPVHANPTCILNCAQCVKIYGEFFDGHKCAKVCMDSQSNKFDAFVDCADPTTIARFLKSF